MGGHGVCQACGTAVEDSRVMLKLKVYIDRIYKLQLVYCRAACLKSDLGRVRELVVSLYPAPLHFPPDPSLKD